MFLEKIRFRNLMKKNGLRRYLRLRLAFGTPYTAKINLFVATLDARYGGNDYNVLEGLEILEKIADTTAVPYYKSYYI